MKTLKEIKEPELPDLKDKVLLLAKEEFLKLNNLNIGDHIIWNFRFDTLRGAYKKREMNKYSAHEKSEGILKIDDNGYLFVESIKDYTFYNLTSNGFTGRSRKEWYKMEKRKSRNYFGVGFIHQPKND